MTLRLSHVHKSFGDVEVLSDVSVEIPTGSRFALVGASGSGKSTLLRLIAGFEQPDAGRIELDGRLLAGDGGAVAAHRRGIGYVPQDGALFPHLTVARNIAFGLRRGRDPRRRVAELMELASLDPELADHLPHELSGGQQQRVALARTLAVEPRVVLLDEPFSALDTGLRAQTRQGVISVLERSGVTAVLVTHDQQEALSFGDALGVVVDGRLAQQGAPAAVFDAPADLGIARFLGDTILVPAARSAAGPVDSALGPLAVRHDLAAGADRVVGMLRPDQLHLGHESGTAVVTAVHPRGVDADIDLRLGDGSDLTVDLRHRVPARDAHLFTPGARATVTIDGGAVLYAADPTSAEPREG